MLLPNLTTAVPMATRAGPANAARSAMGRASLFPTRGVEPLQQASVCHDVTGPCTHSWPWYSGTQCTTGVSGEQQCCSGAFQYPYIRECQNPDGSWRVVSQRCNFCI